MHYLLVSVWNQRFLKLHLCFMCGEFSSDMDVLADPLTHLSVSAFILAHRGK